MKSNTYKPYTPPVIEIIEVGVESAVLQASTAVTSTESMDNETFNW